MAGIGFELKKLFKKKGLIAMARAYGYTGAVTAGPMLLGIALILVVTNIGHFRGLSNGNQELLTSMITYSLLASLTLTSLFSMVVSRFIADVLYEEKADRILPSLFGNLCILLPLGGIPYGIFLFFSGGKPLQCLLNFIFFMELVVQWTMMNDLSAVKNYKGILRGFLLALAAAFLSALILTFFFPVSVSLLLFCVCLSYGLMVLVDLRMILEHFPVSFDKPFSFLHWFDEYRELAWIGLFMTIGLFSHLLIAWFGGVGMHVGGLYFAAPRHDVPAMYAFLTILPTTVNFVASVEVNFYPYYRKFYDLFNGTGSVKEIELAETDMLEILKSELSNMARKQFYITAALISIGVMILDRLPLGFDDLMNGYFRILCVGYGAYAIGNVLMLMLLYFADDAGALRASAIFAVTTTEGCLLSLRLDVRYYGFAFALGALVFLLYALFRLDRYTRRLPFHILSRQPIVEAEKVGVFTKLERKLQKRG